MKRSCWILLAAAVGLCGQTKERVSEINGPELFKAHCAACHGVDGRGAGPAVKALAFKPPDLTLLARQNKGKFPRTRVEQSIMGNERTPAHGSADMPIWGPAFAEVAWDRDLSRVRLKNVVDHLVKLQRQ